MRGGAARAVRSARLARRLVSLEWSQRPGPVHPSMWRRGFVSSRRELYPGITDPAVPYLSDATVERRLRTINSPTAQHLLDDKLAFGEALTARGLADRAPEIFGVVLAGSFRPRTPGATRRLTTHESVVLKPVTGRGGRGVAVVRSADVVSGPLPAGDDLLVQERLLPAPDWEDIHPATLNTIRVVALRPAHGPPVIAAAVHRFGTAASGAVDNVSSGGICSRIDLTDGTLGAAVASGRPARRVELHRHPDSGRQITGRQVPRWDAVMALAMELMSCFPELDHAGWDLCLTDRGPLVLEGNGGTPNPNIVQFHGPFLENPTVREFYASHGIHPS